jgi:hypothetical protein
VPIAGRTWEQIRTSIGYNLGAYRTLEADGQGSPETFVTDELSLGGGSEYLGAWLVFTSGSNNAGAIRRVTASSINDSNNQQTLTFHPAVADATANGDTAELWSEDYNPEALLDFANQAIMDAYGAVYDDVEDISLHGDSTAARFDIPSGFSMLKRVEYRVEAVSLEVHPMDTLFDETTDANFTQVLDTEDWKRHGQSLQITVGSGVSAGDFVTDSIGSTDISKYTHMEGWVKATVALAASDFVIHLDSGAVQADGTDLESLSVPAVAANTWTFVRLALANPELDAAIISVGLEYNANQKANVVWFNDFRAVINDSARWKRLGQRSWGIDKEARDLILTADAVNTVGYALIKLVGGGEPALFSTDASVTEIDDQYVVAQTTALSLDSVGGGGSDDDKARVRRSLVWYARAERRRRSFSMLLGVRKIE